MSDNGVEYASKGVAGAGLGLGIAGTALSLFNNGGLGMFGNGASAMFAQMESKESASLRQEVAALRAEKYADSVATQVFERALQLSNKNDEAIKALYKELAKEVVEIRGALALESERRINGDQNLFNYVNATFVAGKLVMPADKIEPEVMPRYNSWIAPTAQTQTQTA